MFDLANTISTLGVALLLGAYAGRIRGFISQEKIYLLLNLFGATLAAIGSFLIPFWPFVILEGVWAIIAALELIRLAKNGGEDRPVSS